MTPNHYRTDGIEGRGGILLIFSIIFTGLALALVLSRLYIRHAIVGQLGSDDVASGFSMVLSYPLSKALVQGSCLDNSVL